MSYAIAVPALRSRAATEWPLLRPTVPVEWPNSSGFSKPKDAPWARFSILSDFPTEAIAAGPDSPERIYGRVQLEIFVPLGAGQLTAYQLGTDWASIWRDEPIVGALFYATQIIEVGRAPDDPAWWKVDCLTEFEYEFST